MADLFISYSRRDTEFVARLRESLAKLGREPWVDVHGIRPAEDFMQAIREAIDSALAFVFVLSPDSVVSKICARELDYAVQGNKRLIPVVCRQVEGLQVPGALSDLNWISFLGAFEPKGSLLSRLFEPNQFDRAVRQLIAAADADPAWIREHTRVLQRAREWHARGRSESLLLQGEDLEATLALAGDRTRQPQLTGIQRQFLDASARAAKAIDPIVSQLETAKRMHADLLPSRASALPNEERFDLYARRDQAAQVGGDWYDYYRIDDDRVLIVVADVSGKGLPASYFMTVAKAMFKSAALRLRSTIAEVMREVDKEVSRDNPGEMFATAFAAILDASTGRLEYCNAGSEPPVVVIQRDDSAVLDLGGEGGPPLGTVDGFAYESACVDMQIGDVLCVFTDGLIEAGDGAGNAYGRERLKTLLGKIAHSESAEAIGEAVLRDLNEYVTGSMPTDDRTILVLRRNRSRQGPPPEI